ncbi:MAG TPA: hypothetical protein VLC91_00350 [Spongiibacteraceae bacterium]|nr:hypothetical protein [Spongiibacteraceae bacterium]
MNYLFWLIAAADGVLFTVMLFGMLQGGSDSGGREMGIFFFVLVPSLILLAAVLLHVFSRGTFWRMFALFIVAGPGLLFLGTQVRSVYIDYRIAQTASGRGYFDTKPLQALGAAVVACDAAALKDLAFGLDINTRGENGMTLLGLATERAFENPDCASGSRLAVVQQLLALGADANSGLDAALKIDDITFLRTLLDAGANPNQSTEFDQPVVFGRLSNLPPDHLRLLIERGLDKNAISYGNPLAFELAVKRRWDLLALLIESGADWRKPRPDGRTVAGDIAAQITELQQQGDLPADLLRVRDLIDKQPSPTMNP